MKTSNKIILIAGIVVIIFMLALTFKVKNKVMSKVVEGNGIKIEQTIAFEKISSLTINGIETEFVFSDKEEAVLSIDENLLYLADFESNNGNVKIGLRRDSFYHSLSGIKVKLYYKNLDSLFINLANCSGSLMDSAVYVKLSGNANFQFDGTRLDVVGRNSSKVILSGSCESLNVNLVNSSDLDSRELKTNYCYVRAANSSDAIVHVLKELNVELINSSDVEYFGDGILNMVETKNSSSIKKGEY